MLKFTFTAKGYPVIHEEPKTEIKQEPKKQEEIKKG
jgi:hypothetical protein